MQGRGGKDKVKAIHIQAIISILAVFIIGLMLGIFIPNTATDEQILSLKAQLKTCQEMPMPKCETLEDRIKWCESKIMHHADAINHLLSRKNGLD